MMTEETPQNPADQTPAAMPADKEHHVHIYDVLMKQDEITWRSIILELIKTEQMDPWDINISKLAKMYIKALKKLKEMNLQLSGKVLLAAALLLRIKSSRLVGEDMMEFDRLLASGEEEDLYSDEGFVEGELGAMGMRMGEGQLALVPKTPQPRKRKVSVYDLIDALAIALNVRRRRILNQIQTKTMEVPEKTTDISQLMDNLYNDVVAYLTREQSGRIAFSDLVPGESKEDKIFTFVPLLHLTNARKVDLAQKKHFDEIWISLAKKKEKAKKSKKAELQKAEPKQSENPAG